MNYSGVALQFGVTINDFSYLNSFKELLNESYQVIENTGYDINKLLRCHQGSLPDRLLLKERITLGCPIRRLGIPAGTYLWIIRHFLSMLPKPLMYREKKDHWIKLSDMCKTWIETKSHSAYTSKELIEKISQIMITLPEYNQIMCFYLFDFLRQLSLLSETYPVAKRFNRNTALTLSRYFAGCLFQKPPNFDHRIEKRYYFVVLFTVTKWTEISTEFVTHNSTCHMFLQRKASSTKTKVLFFGRQKPRETSDFTMVNLIRKPLSLNKISTRNSISSQTDVCFNYFNSEFSELGSLSLKNFQNDYLKDFGCQTEFYDNLLPKTFNNVIRIRGCCWCCENGRKFEEDNQQQLGLVDDFSQTEVDDFVNEGHDTRSFCNESKFYTATSGSFFPGWRLPQIETGIKKTETIFENLQPYYSSLTSFHSQNSSTGDDLVFSSIPALNDEKLTKDYPGFCENVKTQSSPKNLYPDLQTFNLLAKEESSSNEILEKIQSIGWTYSPQIENQQKLGDLLSKNQDKSKDFVRYRLNFDKFSKEEPIEEITEEEDTFYPPRTYSDDIVVSKSKKKMFKLGKLKLNLSIANFFTNGTTKLKRSLSFHQVASNVKYKKM